MTLFWVKAGGVVAVIAAIIAGVVSYGNGRYNDGVVFQQGQYAKAVTQQTDGLTTELVKAQKEALAKLQGELDLARGNLLAASDRQAELQTTIAGLQNVKETNCTRINNESVVLLNKAACDYNRKHRVSGGVAIGCSDSRSKPSGARAVSVSGDTGASVSQH